MVPRDITYDLVMLNKSKFVIVRGLLSALQLEALVYGCQRHLMDLPDARGLLESEKENVANLGEVRHHSVSVGAGSPLGDGAGVGTKGRTIAGFVLENASWPQETYLDLC